VTPKTPGKTAFFGHEGPLIGDKEIVPGTPLGELHDCVSGIVEDARNGIRNLHICTDFLKDELRPLHKVEQVATRVISGTCIAYTIAVRMYFGAFLAAMFATHVKNGMAPGVNHYTEWCDLAHGLLSDGRVKVSMETFLGLMRVSNRGCMTLSCVILRDGMSLTMPVTSLRIDGLGPFCGLI
jgi:hypothetical protein